jgi:hypothetical protein
MEARLCVPIGEDGEADGAHPSTDLLGVARVDVLDGRKLDGEEVLEAYGLVAHGVVRLG